MASASCRFRARCGEPRGVGDDPGMEVVLFTETADGVAVILSALVYAKILEAHPEAADLGLIDRTLRAPDVRRPDPWPTRERFLRREGRLRLLAVVEYDVIPAVVVTVFSSPTATPKP